MNGNPPSPPPDHLGGIRALLSASHPVPAAAVTVTMALLAAAVGHTRGGVLLVTLAVLAGQLSIGWCNDAVDAERDRLSGRTDKPVAHGLVSARTTGTAAGVALGICLPLSLAAGTPAGAVHLLAVASGWAYDLKLKRTVASALPYAVSFGLLPAFVTLALPAAPMPPAWLVLTGALLGIGAHLLNVLPDIDEDLATGVRGLPHRLSRRANCATATGCLVAASVLLSLAPPGPPDVLSWIGLVIGAATALFGTLAVAVPEVGRSPAPFRAALGVAVVDVALLVGRGLAIT